MGKRSKWPRGQHGNLGMDYRWMIAVVMRMGGDRGGLPVRGTWLHRVPYARRRPRDGWRAGTLYQALGE